MRVVIVDDEMAMHLIMRRMLEKIDRIEVVESFQDSASAFTFLKRNPVDLVFMDIQMPGESGLDFARRLRAFGLSMKLIFVTSHKEYALPAFDVYAYDYIIKPVSQKRLNETLERAHSEEHTYKEKEMPAQSIIEPLTKREKEVLQLMSNGLSNKEIANMFELSEGTIKNHTVNIYGKLQVKNRVQATIRARRLKIIQ